MKQKIEKVKTFIEKYKKEVLIGTGLTVVGGIVFVVSKKKLKLDGVDFDNISQLPGLTKLEVSDSLIKKGIVDVSSHKPEKWMDIWFDNTPLSELGDVGKELCEIYGWKPDQTISGVVSTAFDE